MGYAAVLLARWPPVQIAQRYQRTTIRARRNFLPDWIGLLAAACMGRRGPSTDSAAAGRRRRDGPPLADAL